MQKEFEVNQNKAFASGRDAMSAAGYEFKGTATIKGTKKTSVHDVMELDGNRVLIVSCKVVRYKIKKLVISDFTGKTDQELQAESEAAEAETKTEK